MPYCSAGMSMPEAKKLAENLYRCTLPQRAATLANPTCLIERFGSEDPRASCLTSLKRLWIQRSLGRLRWDAAWRTRRARNTFRTIFCLRESTGWSNPRVWITSTCWSHRRNIPSSGTTIPHLSARRTVVPRQRRRQVPRHAGVANFPFVDESGLRICSVWTTYRRLSRFFRGSGFWRGQGACAESSWCQVWR